MKEKNNCLPFYETEGIVIHGRGNGRLLGMPTANLKIENDDKLPKPGVYISRIYLNEQPFYGVTHIGKRPTIDDDKDISFETHILNFNEDIYGQKLKIQLFSKIRPIKKFAELPALFDQIRKDCVVAQEYWGIKQSDLELFMDIVKHQVKINNQEILLSSKEFDVLYLLYSNPDVIFTKKQIYEAIWHKKANDISNVIENTIYRIRRKIKKNYIDYDFIKTIKGYGYKFKK